MTKSQFWSLCALFTLIFSLPAFGQRATDPSGASLAILPGWTQGEAAHGASLILYAPDPLPDFRPNTNLVVQTSDSIDLEGFYRISLEEAELSGTITEGYEPVTLDDGSEARRMILHVEFGGRQLSCLSVWTVKDGRIYLISGTTTAEDFPARQAEFWEVARTLQTDPPRGGPIGGSSSPFPTGFGGSR